MSVDTSKRKTSNSKYMELPVKIANHMLTLAIGESGRRSDSSGRLRLLTDKLFDHADALVMHTRTMGAIYVTDDVTFEQFRYHAYEAKGRISSMSSLLTIAYDRVKQGIPQRAKRTVIGRLGAPDKENAEEVQAFNIELAAEIAKLQKSESNRFNGFADDLREERKLLQGKLNAARKYAANLKSEDTSEKQAVGDGL